MGQTHQVRCWTSFSYTRSHCCSRQQKVDYGDSVFASGLDDPRSVVVQVPIAACARLMQRAMIAYLHNFISVYTFSYLRICIIASLHHCIVAHIIFSCAHPRTPAVVLAREQRAVLESHR
jgi:hypothetical protein